jgi:hypothetical protein
MQTTTPHPAVSIWFTEHDSQLALLLSRNDGALLNRIEWPFDRDLEAAGYHALCQGVGDRALRMLAAAEPNYFARYPGLLPPPLHSDTTYGVIDALIQRSFKEQTCAYINTIDRLAAQPVGPSSDDAPPASWPATRQALLDAFGPPKTT